MLILHDFAIVFFDIPTHRPFGNYRPPRAQKKRDGPSRPPQFPFSSNQPMFTNS